MLVDFCFTVLFVIEILNVKLKLERKTSTLITFFFILPQGKIPE
jgi:hypothetical protein